jgi:DNA-binding transcriptional LysR family regulator
VELRHLEYFLAVVEEGSFTRAAARLYMVQSSLSAALLALERELGTDLFIRGRRGTQLTDAGRALVEPARTTLADAERARESVDEVKGLVSGSVRVASVAVPRACDVVETIRRFRADHPGVVIELIHDGARDLVGLVAQGQVDFAVTPLTGRATPALRFEPIMTTPVALLVPRGHRLAGARDVTPRDLVDEVVIHLPRGWWARELFDQVLRTHDCRLPVRLEVNEWFGMLTMVERGVGVSYGPLACVDEEIFRDVEHATIAQTPDWELGIVTRDESLRGAAGRAFLAAYREGCRRGLASGGS